MLKTLSGLFAAIFIVLAGYAVYATATYQSVVVPTNGVRGSSIADNPAGDNALIARTQRQRWRDASTISPDIQAADEAKGQQGSGQPAMLDKAKGKNLVQTWQNNVGTQSGILRQPQFIEGQTSLPGAMEGVLVQPDGRTWRTLHNGPVVYGGALYLLGILALLAVFLFVRGRVDVDQGFSGETVTRFSAFERANHWLTAGSFVVLAITGLITLYGTTLIRPWLGATRYGPLSSANVWVHMSMILPFSIGLLVMIGIWTRQNLFSKVDWTWLKHGGGIVRADSHTPPADRFNAGQKVIFWSVITGGIVLVVSGLGLMFPFLWAGYLGMQSAQLIHAAVALVMIGIIFGHIYIGTVGMRGAFNAMWSGKVDRNWAREHHSIWYKKMFASSGKEPAE